MFEYGMRTHGISNRLAIQASFKGGGMNTTKLSLDLEAKVSRCIDDALELADMGGRTVPTHQIAERIYEQEPSLMREVTQGWIIDRLIWMISRRRRDRWNAKHPWLQLRLPEFPEEPKTVFLASGRRVKFDSCTVRDIEDHIRALKQRYAAGPRISNMERVAETMRPYAAVRRGVTWYEVKKQEIERRDNE